MSRLINVVSGAVVHLPYRFSSCGIKRSHAPKRRIARRRFPGVKLTSRELMVFREEYGPVLSLECAAVLANLAPITLKKQVSEGKYASCTKRGKPILFLTERFVTELFGGSRL